MFSLHTCFSDDHVGIAIPRNGASWSGLKNVCNCVIKFRIDTVLRGYAFLTLPVPDVVIDSAASRAINYYNQSCKVEEIGVVIGNRLVIVVWFRCCNVGGIDAVKVMNSY